MDLRIAQYPRRRSAISIERHLLAGASFQGHTVKNASGNDPAVDISVHPLACTRVERRRGGDRCDSNSHPQQLIAALLFFDQVELARCLEKAPYPAPDCEVLSFERSADECSGSKWPHNYGAPALIVFFTDFWYLLWAVAPAQGLRDMCRKSAD
jgi:hypothetical protein